MRERVIEAELCRTVKLHGGVAEKLIITAKSNFPDRTVLLPYGYIAFAECKAPNKNLSKMQHWYANKVLKALGFKVFIVRCSEDIDAILQDYAEFLDKRIKNANCMEPRPTPKILRKRRRKKICGPAS